MGINKVAIVADLGESYGNYSIGADEDLLDLVTTSNIACGFHAGDPRVLDKTVAECMRRGVELGAHPGYPDLVGFGRRLIEASEEEIRTDVLYQLGALDAFARVHGGQISHVAPHGRMGSIAQTDLKHAVAITDAVKAYNDDYIVVCQRGVLASESEKRGLKVAYVFLPTAATVTTAGRSTATTRAASSTIRSWSDAAQLRSSSPAPSTRSTATRCRWAMTATCCCSTAITLSPARTARVYAVT